MEAAFQGRSDIPEEEFLVLRMLVFFYIKTKGKL
jgi:hypothetical protein